MNPDWERTVHCLGDLHAGAITRARMDAVSRDIELLGPPALHLQVGDATENGRDVIGVAFPAWFAAARAPGLNASCQS